MVWKHISVSQIKTYRRNPARWVLEKLEGLPTVTGEGAKIGTYIHKIMEGLLKGFNIVLDERNPHYPIGKKFLENILQIDLSFAIGCQAEKDISLILDDELPMLIGYIDQYNIQYNFAPLISDLKVSKSRRFFLKVEDLKEDLQLMVYAYWAIQINQYATGAWIQQVQYAYNIKREPIKIVRTYVTRAEIEKFMLDLVSELKSTMVLTYQKWARNKYEALSFRNNCENCKCAFGPNSCEFSRICEGKWSTENYISWYNEVIAEDDEKIPGGKMPNTKYTPLRLSWLFQTFRKETDKESNTWTRREKLTDKVLKIISEQHDVKTTIVILPAHMREKISPEYEPVVTRLHELGYTIVIDL